MNIIKERKYFYLLAIIGLIFIITRFFTLLAFPIFNDEGLYVQFAQLISENWDQYKYISMENVFRHWKPPLQYWIGAVFISFFQDPLLATRISILLFSVIGIIGTFFFVLNLYDKKTAIFASLFFVLSPAITFWTIQYTAEGFIFSTAAVFLFALIRILQAPADKIRFWEIILAIVSGAALMFFKQTSAVYFYIFLLLPIFFFFEFIKNNHFKDVSFNSKQERKKYFETKANLKRNVIIFFAAIILALLFYKISLPAKMFELDIYTASWTLSLKEILSFPLDIWKANLERVYGIYVHYYGWPAMLAFVGFIALAFWRKNWKDVMLSALFIFASGMIIFGLKNFMEYIYICFTALFLIVMAARFFIILLFETDFSYYSSGARKGLKSLIVLLAVAMLGGWIYQTYLMAASPMKYLEQGTGRMRGDDLLGWPNGFNVGAIVDLLKSQSNPSVAFIDPQWGNPGTALQIYQKYYPHVKLAFIGLDLLKPEVQSQINQMGFKNKLLIYSKTGNAQDLRNQWQIPLEKMFCQNKQEFKKYELQTPIVVCQWQ